MRIELADYLALLLALVAADAHQLTYAAAPSEPVQYAQIAAPLIALGAVAATVWGLLRAGRQQAAALTLSERNHTEALRAGDEARYREATREAIAATIGAFHAQIEALRAELPFIPAYAQFVAQALIEITGNEQGERSESLGRVAEMYQPYYEASRSADAESRRRMALSQMYYERGSDIGEATWRAFVAIKDARVAVQRVSGADELDGVFKVLETAGEGVQELASTVGAAYRPDGPKGPLPKWWFGF